MKRLLPLVCFTFSALSAGCAQEKTEAPVAAAPEIAQQAAAPLPTTIPEAFHISGECNGKSLEVSADSVSVYVTDCRLIQIVDASPKAVRAKVHCTRLGDEQGESIVSLVRTENGVNLAAEDGSIQCEGYAYQPSSPGPAALPLSEVPATAAAKPAPITCDVKDAYGRTVTFRDTVSLALLDPSLNDPCAIADDLVAVLAERAAQALEKQCAEDAGYCEGEWRAKNLELYTFTPEVYSIGAATYLGKSCPAYLYVVSEADHFWNVLFRFLGACAGKEEELLEMQVGIQERTGRMPLFGDLLTAQGYAGAMPEQFTLRGQRYPFRTVKQAPRPSGPTPDDLIAQAYAKELTAHWSHANHCFDLMQQLYKYTGTGEPADVQMRRMDQIYDGAARAGCIRD